MRFDSVAGKASLYMNRTFVLASYKKRKAKVYYSCVEDGYICLFLNSEDKPLKITEGTIKDWVFLCPPVGYVKGPHGVMYISRYPSRSYRVGLTTDNSNIAGTPLNIVSYLQDMVDDNYPTLEDCGYGKVDSPLSKSYALINGKLCHNNNEVGEIVNRCVEVNTESEALFHGMNFPELKFFVKKEEVIDYDQDL